MSVQPGKDDLFMKPLSLVPEAGTKANEATKWTPEQPMTFSTPPNGGFVAWLQVAGAFFLFFNSW